MFETIFGAGSRNTAPRFPQLAELRAYWEGLRVGGAIPARAALDPRGIAGALEQAFVLERVAPGQARFRIAGMHLTDLMGMDVRGMPILTMIAPEARAAFATALEQVFAGPSMVEMTLEAERGIGKPALEGRLMILPLLGEDGTVDRAVGVLVTHGLLGRAPRRFSIAQRIVTPVAQKAPEPVFAEAPVTYTPPPRAPAGRSHLRLVNFD